MQLEEYNMIDNYEVVVKANKGVTDSNGEKSEVAKQRLLLEFESKLLNDII